MVQLWLGAWTSAWCSSQLPKRTAAFARLAEEMGFASLRFPDSQNLAPEVWGQLMLAAAATTPHPARARA